MKIISAIHTLIQKYNNGGMNITEFLKQQKLNKALTPSEKYFLDWILANASTLNWHESISSLSNRCSLSQSSITKFFNKIGINGYKGFCMHLANSKEQAHVENPMVKSLVKTINTLEKTQIKSDVEKLASLIVEKQNVSLIASNFSYIGALKFQRQLRMAGITVNLYDSNDETFINNDDSIKVFISSSGQSKTMNKAFAWVQSFGNDQKIFAITSNYICTIKAKVDGHIYGYVISDKAISKNHSLIKWSILNHCLDHVFVKISEKLKSSATRY